MIFVGIYARVSTAEQAENYSIPEQIDRAKKYCEAMGWQVFKVYSDPGFSGSTTDRPALQSLIRDVQAGKIQKVLVYKLDRISRSQKDVLTLVEDVFLASGCDFVSMSESFDTATPFGRATVGILAVFAQLERENIKERLAMGRDARARSGKYHGSPFVPVGYNYEDGQLVPDSYESMLVRKIFEMYDDGMSPFAIASELNDKNLTRAGAVWNRSTVYNILQSRTYVGFIRHRDEWLPGCHEPIIQPDLFDRVQDRIVKESAAHKRKRNPAASKSLLSGLLVCGQCGGKYAKCSHHVSRAGKNYDWIKYGCTNRLLAREKGRGPEDRCTNKHWDVSELDALVMNEISKLRLDPDHLPETRENDHAAEARVLREQIAKNEKQIDRLIGLYGEDGIPLESLKAQIDALSAQNRSLQEEADKISGEMEKEPTLAECAALVNSLKDLPVNEETKRGIISALIDHIVLDGDDVSIFWRF